MSEKDPVMELVFAWADSWDHQPHHLPIPAMALPSLRAKIAAELAAAEERGRRRGVEERDELRALLKEWLPALCALKPWPKVGSMLACGKCLGCRTLIALAPRDSGKEG